MDLFVTYAYSGRICPLESFIVFSNHYMLKARKYNYAFTHAEFKDNLSDCLERLRPGGVSPGDVKHDNEKNHKK